MPEQVPEEIKHERLQRLMDLQNQISLEINEKMVGQSYLLMVEGPSKNNKLMLSGRTDGNKIVVFPAPEGRDIKAGDCLMVKITAAHTWNLEGELASDMMAELE